jgi:PTH1 family peptidyl-tRNA hydrolase
MKLIFAQGNPGTEYEKSRHNVGFTILNTIASELNSTWTDKPKFHALLSEVVIGGEKVLLAKPTTFYNESGSAVRALIDFYKLDPAKDLLVIHDDFALPFGVIRIRQQGSDAGNNGIKSINAHINQNYARVRVGIWSELREKMDDAEFVLAKFNSEENSLLEKNIVPQVVTIIKQFCSETVQPTSYKTLE